MEKSKNNIAVLGAGPMGLTCAYELLKKGYEVSIFEADDRIGGMSATYDLGGLTIERFYHFIVTPDLVLFDMLKELDIIDKLKWTSTHTGFFYNGKIYSWDTPLDILLFPKIDIISKLRYGFHIFSSTKRKKWQDLDKISAITWVQKNVGEKAFYICWKRLFDLKFYEYKNKPSAAWLWTRLKRLGVSRKSLFKNKLGYIEGGSHVVLQTMLEKIKGMGGKLFLNSPVEKILIKNSQVQGIKVKGKSLQFNKVISTIPLPYLVHIGQDLPEDTLEKIKHIENIGIVCVMLKLSHKLSNYFWLNINDPSIDTPGIVEYSNLNPLSDTIIYLPFYLHKYNQKYKESDEKFLEKTYTYLTKINPKFKREWVRASKVNRYMYAQPICTTEFLKKLPQIKSEIQGFYMADTSYCYPEDRYMDESIKIAQKIVTYIEPNKNPL
jgi:protoporphyrinogen oxidase